MESPQQHRDSIKKDNVNPGLINHGLLIRGYSSNSQNPIQMVPPQLTSLGVY